LNLAERQPWQPIKLRGAAATMAAREAAYFLAYTSAQRSGQAQLAHSNFIDYVLLVVYGWFSFFGHESKVDYYSIT
jgi:hypothetical protein